MINEQTFDPTIEVLLSLNKRNQMTFDNPCQRGLVWSRLQKSKFIDSIINGYFIPPVFANQVNGVYDIIDGKQRNFAIFSFVADEFKLLDIEDVEVKDGQFEHVAGKRFSQLSEFLQNEILQRVIHFNYAKDLTQEEVEIIFDYLNSGKALTGTEMIKAKTKSKEAINSLANHELFNHIVTDSAKNKSQHINYVTQAYMVLFEDEMPLTSVVVQGVMSSRDITPSQIDSLRKIFDKFLEVWNLLSENESSNKIVLMSLKKKTHFVSIMPVIEEAVDNNIPTIIVANWILHFFTNRIDTATISKEYNASAQRGTNKTSSITTRTKATYEDFMQFKDTSEAQSPIVETQIGMLGGV